MNNILARIDKGSYHAYALILIEHHHFSDCYVHEKRTKRIKNYRELLIDIVTYFGYVLKYFKRFKKTDVIVAVGFLSLIFKVMIKLKLISCKKFIWLGFQVHTPKLYGFFKFMLKATAIPQEIFLLNAAYEADIYEKELGIPAHKMQTLQYSDWGSTISPEEVQQQHGNYYFAGGYTNRDYEPVIEVFKKNGRRLIIVGSVMNQGLSEELPNNITILKDIPKREFAQLLNKAKVCILPMKKITGASGQMVLLNYMKNGKPIIASDVPSVHEYVKDEESAIFYNTAKDLEEAVERVENSLALRTSLGKQAIAAYQRNFSKDVLVNKFSKIIDVASEG